MLPLMPSKMALALILAALMPSKMALALTLPLVLLAGIGSIPFSNWCEDISIIVDNANIGAALIHLYLNFL